jgi:hypothetical protein
MGVGVGVGVLVGVEVGVGVSVTVGVSVGMGVEVGDGSSVGVSVGWTTTADWLCLTWSWQAGKKMTPSKSVSLIPARDDIEKYYAT